MFPSRSNSPLNLSSSCKDLSTNKLDTNKALTTKEAPMPIRLLVILLASLSLFFVDNLFALTVKDFKR